MSMNPYNNEAPSLMLDGTRARPRRRLRRPSRATSLVAGVAAGVAVAGGGGFAIAAATNRTIHGCINSKSRVLTVQTRCGKGSTSLTWSERGPRGATGKTGATGPRGLMGSTGAQGPAGGPGETLDFGVAFPSGGVATAVSSGLDAATPVANGETQVTYSCPNGPARDFQVTADTNYTAQGLNFAAYPAGNASASGQYLVDIFESTWDAPGTPRGGSTGAWDYAEQSFYLTVIC